MRDLGLLRFPANPNHIKARLTVLQVMPQEIMQRRLGDLTLFARIHGFQRITKLRTTMAAYLYEYDRVAIQGNEIDFAKRGPIILGDNRIVLRSEKFFRFTLPRLMPPVALDQYAYMR